MSVSFGCKCNTKNKENWIVLHRKHNHSAFETPKYGKHPSEYSTVRCTVCCSIGQTKAKYVDSLHGDCINSSRDLNTAEKDQK